MTEYFLPLAVSHSQAIVRYQYVYHSLVKGDACMPPITVGLEPSAEHFLREKVRGHARGHGKYLSCLLLAQKAREERAEERKQEPVSTRESWRQSGVNVD